MKRQHLGSKIEDFLAEDGILEECRASAIKFKIAHELQRAMNEQNLSKVEIAKRLKTSRTGSGPAARSRKHVDHAQHDGESSRPAGQADRIRIAISGAKALLLSAAKNPAGTAMQPRFFAAAGWH